MINNKRGISGIIVALIMILLALVAAGIIWVVVRNVAQSGTEDVNLGSKCLAANVEATKVVVTDEPVNKTYQVTLRRDAGGEAIGGVKVILTNATGTDSYVYDSSGNIGELATKTVDVDTTADGGEGIVNANEAEVVVYFENEAGEEQLCSQGSTFEFTV